MYCQTSGKFCSPLSWSCRWVQDEEGPGKELGFQDEVCTSWYLELRRREKILDSLSHCYLLSYAKVTLLIFLVCLQGRGGSQFFSTLLLQVTTLLPTGDAEPDGPSYFQGITDIVYQEDLSKGLEMSVPGKYGNEHPGKYESRKVLSLLMGTRFIT